MDLPPLTNTRRIRRAVEIRRRLLEQVGAAMPLRALDGTYRVEVKHIVQDGLILELRHKQYGTFHYKVTVKELMHYARDEEAYRHAHRLCTGG